MGAKVEPMAPRMSLRERARVAEYEAHEQRQLFQNAVVTIHKALGWDDFHSWTEVVARVEALRVAAEKKRWWEVWR